MPIDRLNAVLDAHVTELEAAGTAKGAEAVVTGVLPAEGQRGPRFHLEGQGDREFIRFYDFLQDSIRFNILVIDWHGNNPRHILTSTDLHPFTLTDLGPALTAAGFVHQELFGDMNFAHFEKNISANLVIVAS